MKKIKVLIVEDSMMFSSFLKDGLNKDSSIDVVAIATEPFDAVNKIIKYEPDVLTLDVELPKMNGMEFLKKLMPQYPIPVVVVSGTNNNVFDLIRLGAVDFIEKPKEGNMDLKAFIKELTTKIKIASIAKVSHWKNSNIKVNKLNDKTGKNKIICIGASTGGTEAIEEIIKNLPRNMCPILIVQHMPPVFTKMYAQRLNKNCIINVKEASDGDLVTKGTVLIAPGGYHMKIVKEEQKYKVRCFKGEKVNGHCPSVDILFESAAKELKNNAVGVILTGMGYDGAKGMLKMRKAGAITIGQDEESSVVYGMPKVAFEMGAVQIQEELTKISETLISILSVN